MANDNIDVEYIDEKHQHVMDEICKFLEEGMWKKDAAAMAGIDESTFYDWIKKYPSFPSRVEAAVLKYKRNLIRAINIGSLKNASHAFEILRVRWAEEWNIAKKLEHSGGVSVEIKTIADEIQKMIAEGKDDGNEQEN